MGPLSLVAPTRQPLQSRHGFLTTRRDRAGVLGEHPNVIVAELTRRRFGEHPAQGCRAALETLELAVNARAIGAQARVDSFIR